jgi:hypothetical protein
MSAGKTPPPKRRGCVDPSGSFAVTAGPDQREAVVAFTLHQRGVDRAGKLGSSSLTERYSRSVSRAVFFQAAPNSVARLRRCDSRAPCRSPSRSRRIRLDVKRQRLDRSGVAVVRCGKGSDGSHGGLRLVGPRPSRPRWRSLAPVDAQHLVDLDHYDCHKLFAIFSVGPCCSLLADVEVLRQI